MFKTPDTHHTLVSVEPTYTFLSTPAQNRRYSSSPFTPVATRGVLRGCERADYPVVPHVRFRAHVGAGKNHRAAADGNPGAKDDAVALDLQGGGEGRSWWVLGFERVVE